MELLHDILHLIGSAACHQRASSALYVGGEPLPVCARDNGIHIAVLTVGLVTLLRTRFRVNELPPLRVLLVLPLFLVPMGSDVLTHWLGLRQVTTASRVFTGLLAGFPIALVLLPLFVDQFRQRAERVKSVKGFRGLFLPFVALALPLGLLLWPPARGYYLLASAQTTGLLATLFVVYTLGASLLIGAFRIRATFALSAPFGLLLTAAHIALFAFLHALLIP